jgi:SsrA-binding protein
MPASDVKTVATNRKAFHDFYIEERFEAGIELSGTEVKSVRQSALNLKD